MGELNEMEWCSKGECEIDDDHDDAHFQFIRIETPGVSHSLHE